MKMIDDDRGENPISLHTVILQIGLSAAVFMVVLPTMALVMPLWQLGKRLISYNRHYRTTQRKSVAPVLVAEHAGDMHTNEVYYRSLRHFLTVEVRGSFKEQHERPSRRITELLQQIDQMTLLLAH